MPQRDAIHNIIRQALIKEGWEITDDPYVISYGERFLFIDLAARLDVLNGIAGRFIGARRGSSRIAVEIKEFRGNSAIADARASDWSICSLSTTPGTGRSRA